MPRVREHNRGRLLAGLVSVLILMGTAWVVSALETKAPSAPANRWEETIRQFETWDRKNSFSADAVLFVGSSSIVRWTTREHFPTLNVINRGFGGSEISDVNHFIDRIVLPYRPRVIVFYAGDNDIASGKSSQQVLRDYETFTKRVRATLPDTRIVFVSIKPSVSRWHLWPAMTDANRRIERFSHDDPGLLYADVATPLLASDGEPRRALLDADGLHLNDDGYKVWTRVLTPIIERALPRPIDDMQAAG